MTLVLRLRQLARIFRFTPLHPQWLVLKGQSGMRREVGTQLAGVVLDIGCAGSELRPYVLQPQRYIGLDYPATAETNYRTRPDVFSDGQCLPLGDATIDSVALLDVLEHLPVPERCLREISRVLKPGGTLVLQVPFLYPLHDEPRDYTRWTLHGLMQLVNNNGFDVHRRIVLGHPAETAAVLFNIALAKILLNLLDPINPLAWVLFAALLPLSLLLVPLVNLAGWCLARLTIADPMMPFGYRLICTCRGHNR